MLKLLFTSLSVFALSSGCSAAPGEAASGTQQAPPRDGSDADPDAGNGGGTGQAPDEHSGGTSDENSDGTSDENSDGTSDENSDGNSGETAKEDLDMEASDFGCILEGTKVGTFFLQNPLGHLAEAVAVANSPTGGVYPVGTILQLVPQEAMVKRARGWNAATNDWEFFFLGVSGNTTTIETRGAEETRNAFGGNCFACHQKAAPEWDLVCGDSHGCDPLPLTDSLIESLQNGDSRCR